MERCLTSNADDPQGIGIIAFGSLITEPGQEIAAAIVRNVPDILTPFSVEFARSSRTRAGGPTLVPVETGGSPVRAHLLVVDVSEQEAKNRLWRRETRSAEGRYVHRTKPGPNTLIIDTYPRFGGVAVAIAARFLGNINPIEPQELARLAIQSAAQLSNEFDGISYLINAKRHGIVTPLMPAYEAEILRSTGASSLENALAAIHERGRR
jgi:hypothetical protein